MSAISLKCPNCDGELVFDPKKQKYKCEYCLSVFSEGEINDILEKEVGTTEETTQESQQETIKENQTEEEFDQSKSGKGATIYSCPSCGAEIITEETTASTFCYYCHNPIILKGKLEGEFLPDRIIPFQIDKKEAKEKFMKELSKKKFIPKAFFDKNQIEKITGVYFPYWVYDARMDGSFEAKGVKVRIWVTGSEEYTENKFYHVLRAGEVMIEHITKNALKKANGKLIEGVLPFEIDQSTPFRMALLSGFMAEKRDIESENLKPQMEDEARSYAQKVIKNDIEGYQSLLEENSSFYVQEENMDYMLFPVWSLTYKGKDEKIYYYSMNAQTGKICGKLPVKYSKLLIYSGMIMFLVFLLGLFGGYFLW